MPDTTLVRATPVKTRAASSTLANSDLFAASRCWTRWLTASRRERLPPTPKCCRFPSSRATGLITGEDVQAIVKVQGLAEIGPGDCVALHTGQGNTWSNDRDKTMSADERNAARDLLNQGEPGLGSAPVSTWPPAISR